MVIGFVITNMKKLLALLLLFGIVGCASVGSKTTNSIVTQADNSLCIHILEESTQQYPEYLKCMRNVEKTGDRSANIKKDKLRYKRDIRKERLRYEKKFGTPEEQKEGELLADSSRKERLNLERERKKKLDERNKKKIFEELTDRCNSFGFTGNNNIAACIQREAQHDKEIAIQKIELQRTRVALQKAQSKSYVQPVAEVEAEEELHWAVKFLGDVAMGVAENLADPQFHNNIRQQKEINRLKQACKRTNSC